MEIGGHLIISKVRWKTSPVEMVARTALPQTLRLFALMLAVVSSSEFKDAVTRAQCQAACLQKVGTVDNNGQGQLDIVRRTTPLCLHMFVLLPKVIHRPLLA